MTTFKNLIQTKCFLEQEVARGIASAKKELVKVNEQIKEMKQKPKETVYIEVFYEPGYKWSVDIKGEEESQATNLNKVEAMRVARSLKKAIGNAIILEQKLSKKEKAENIKFLHETSETYNEFYKHR